MIGKPLKLDSEVALVIMCRFRRMHVDRPDIQTLCVGWTSEVLLYSLELAEEVA